MTDVFLSKIAISDFRTFGAFEVALPPVPGLVLVTGPNGLGKSSFFDGIEWALTGEIRRFTPYVTKNGKIVIPEADYLTRHGAKKDGHSVSLWFGDDEVHRRGSGSSTSTVAIASLLAKPGRGEITDLSTHLAMTHFLGQAERQRFTSRNRNEQWAALKGPSGVDRLELIRTRLRGKSTTMAFNRRVKTEQAVVSDIEKRIADWSGWQARLDRLMAAVRAGGGLTKQDILDRARSIEALLNGILGRSHSAVSGESSSQLLARLQTLATDGERSLREREAALEAVPKLIDGYLAQVALSRDDLPLLVEAREQVAAARSAVVQAQAALTGANEAIAAQTSVVATLEGEVSRLEATRADNVRRLELASLLAEARVEFENRSAQIASYRRVIESAEKTLAEQSQVEAEVMRLRAILARATEDADQVAHLMDMDRMVDGQQSQLRLAVHAAEAVQHERDTAAAERDRLDRIVKEAGSALMEAERQASAVSAAVATLAAHLHDDDTICPVCSASYPEGELRLLAAAAAKAGDADVAQASRRLEEHRTSLRLVTQRHADLDALIRIPEELAPAFRQTSAQAENVRQRVASALHVAEDADLTSVAASRLDRARSDVTGAQATFANFDQPAAAARSALAEASAAIDQLASRQDAASARIAALASEDQDRLDRISSRGLPASDAQSLNNSLLRRRGELEAALKRAAELKDVASRNAAALDAQNDRARGAEVALARAQESASAARSAVEDLTRQWQDSGFRGEPDKAALTAFSSELSNKAGRIRYLSEQLLELAENNQNALLEEEIAVVIEQMTAAGGEKAIADPSAHLGKLQSRLDPARAALKLSEDALDAVDKYTVRLGERAKEYNRDVLQPLNDRILEFNAAMLSTPGPSVQFKTDNHVDRTDFEMEIQYDEEIDDSIIGARKVPPQVVLSEGQLAANGFSILCAASTAYQWSRWRALLLDDPLQHNDIIHAAAFVDVMRNLVQLEGYQLIVSSHDRAESDFISRKFDAANLPCTNVLLTAPSEEGVVFDPPSYNAAARRHLSIRSAGATLIA